MPLRGHPHRGIVHTPFAGQIGGGPVRSFGVIPIGTEAVRGFGVMGSPPVRLFEMMSDPPCKGIVDDPPFMGAMPQP